MTEEYTFDCRAFLEENAGPGELERVRKMALRFAGDVHADSSLEQVLEAGRDWLLEALAELEPDHDLGNFTQPLTEPALDALMYGDADLKLWRAVMAQREEHVQELVELAQAAADDQ